MVMMSSGSISFVKDGKGVEIGECEDDEREWPCTLRVGVINCLVINLQRTCLNIGCPFACPYLTHSII